MEQEKTHWKNFHPSKYIGSVDFKQGEQKILTIQRAGKEGVKDNKGKEESCLVVHFQGDHKPMICNVTNSKAIAQVAGSNYIEDWSGIHVELFITEVLAFGEMVDAVRIKPSAPRIQKPELTPDHKAWSKVIEAVQKDSSITRAKVEKKYAVSDDTWDLIESKKEEQEVI